MAAKALPSAGTTRWRGALRRSSPAELTAAAVAAVGVALAATMLLPDSGERHTRAGPAAAQPAAGPRSGPAPESRRLSLSRPGRVSRYAFVERPAVVRAGPRGAARSLGRLRTRTPDGTDEVVLVVQRRVDAGHVGWLRVRTPLLPTGTAGWVPSTDLSTLRRVHTWVVVERSARRLTLIRDGRVVLRAPVGIGKPATPTPGGRFYIRDRLTGLRPGGMYGPEAFGTSARSTTVTDWPGGSVVGIHGTNRPDLIPGRVSHGCIRMRNADVVRVARLAPVGTPLTIR